MATRGKLRLQPNNTLNITFNIKKYSVEMSYFCFVFLTITFKVYYVISAFVYLSNGDCDNCMYSWIIHKPRRVGKVSSFLMVKSVMSYPLYSWQENKYLHVEFEPVFVNTVNCILTIKPLEQRYWGTGEINKGEGGNSWVEWRNLIFYSTLARQTNNYPYYLLVKNVQNMVKCDGNYETEIVISKEILIVIILYWYSNNIWCHLRVTISSACNNSNNNI